MEELLELLSVMRGLEELEAEIYEKTKDLEVELFFSLWMTLKDHYCGDHNLDPVKIMEPFIEMTKQVNDELGPLKS